MRKCLTTFSRVFECGAVHSFSWFSDWSPKVQKCVNLVDLVKSFQTNIYFQNLASIQPRTGLSKFAKNKPKVRKEVGKNIAPHNRERHDVLRYPEVLEAALRLRAPQPRALDLERAEGIRLRARRGERARELGEVAACSRQLRLCQYQ